MRFKHIVSWQRREDDELSVYSHLIVTSCPKSKSYSLTWAIKMAATASYRAVPSMLMVAPTGSTKRAICLSTPQFSRRHFMVIGNVAELQRKRTGGRSQARVPSGLHSKDDQSDLGLKQRYPPGWSPLTWMTWPARWQGPAAALWYKGRDFCEWRRRRRGAAGWGRVQTNRTAPWWSTCPASLPGGPGRACPGSSLPRGKRCRRGSTCVEGRRSQWRIKGLPLFSMAAPLRWMLMQHTMIYIFNNMTPCVFIHTIFWVCNKKKPLNIWRPSPVLRWQCPCAQSHKGFLYSVGKNLTCLTSASTPMGLIADCEPYPGPASVPDLANALVAECEQIPSAGLQTRGGCYSSRLIPFAIRCSKITHGCNVCKRHVYSSVHCPGRLYLHLW